MIGKPGKHITFTIIRAADLPTTRKGDPGLRASFEYARARYQYVADHAYGPKNGLVTCRARCQRRRRNTLWVQAAATKEGVRGGLRYTFSGVRSGGVDLKSLLSWHLNLCLLCVQCDATY